MQGTILILDGVSTNRIMLKVQLSAAWYHVVQADSLAGLENLLRRTRPDLIVTAMTLPDGTALDLRTLLGSDDSLSAIPIIAISPQNDRAARLRALAAGIEDVLAQPLDDVLLQARIRSLIRSHSAADELERPGHANRLIDLAEGAMEFAGLSTPAVPTILSEVALVTSAAAVGQRWRTQLEDQASHRLRIYQMGDVQALLENPAPDAIVIELPGTSSGVGLSLLADLRARLATRHSAIIAVPNPGNTLLAAEALDRGAHDVLHSGFFADELALRLAAQLRRKTRSDRLREGVRDSLRASVRDPMTGLFNRRYALPKLASIARNAAQTGRSFAVMLADLDHFKAINDRYGHPVGDSVLVESARRLRTATRAQDVISRIGGEEFLIVLPDTDQAAAAITADRLCREFNAIPFDLPGLNKPVHITASIGVVVSPPTVQIQGAQVSIANDRVTSALIGEADQALYKSKDAGRNQFTLIRSAA